MNEVVEQVLYAIQHKPTKIVGGDDLPDWGCIITGIESRAQADRILAECERRPDGRSHRIVKRLLTATCDCAGCTYRTESRSGGDDSQS